MLLFVVLAIACDHFGDTEAVSVMMQLPVYDHCLQLHCSVPCMHNTMQHSCYEFKMQATNFGWLVGVLSIVVDKRGCKFQAS